MIGEKFQVDCSQCTPIADKLGFASQKHQVTLAGDFKPVRKCFFDKAENR